MAGRNTRLRCAALVGGVHRYTAAAGNISADTAEVVLTADGVTAGGTRAGTSGLPVGIHRVRSTLAGNPAFSSYGDNTTGAGETFYVAGSAAGGMWDLYHHAKSGLTTAATIRAGGQLIGTFAPETDCHLSYMLNDGGYLYALARIYLGAAAGLQGALGSGSYAASVLSVSIELEEKGA